MSQTVIKVTLICAYVPLAAVALTYLVALALKGAGSPRLLTWLIRNTSIRQPEIPPGQEHPAQGAGRH